MFMRVSATTLISVCIALTCTLTAEAVVSPSLSSPSSSSPNSPAHIVHVVVDDLGWAEIGIHRDPSDNDAHTPVIDGLITNSGLLLNRFYAHKICSPTRCALQTGRAPIHVNVQNVVPEVRNAEDPIGGYQGIPINMTGMAEHLRSVGYKTHLVGKWDAGMATPRHSPHARGYDNWLGYWHHSNDYWSSDHAACYNKPVKDLWNSTNGTLGVPAFNLANGDTCSQSNQHPQNETCVFEDALLGAQVRKIIQHHDPTSNLFLLWAMHLVHMPLQVPQEYLDKFSNIDNTFRRSMHAMTNYVDGEVGQMVDSLKSTGLWNKTLVVVHADNGGEIKFAGVCGGNNWPLRGGKFSNWEGGIRVNAFVTGGALPLNRRGVSEEGLITAWDWYATYVKGVAGLDPTDHKAAAAGLPKIDSINVWPLISGINITSPRTTIYIGDTNAVDANADGKTLVGGVITLIDGTMWKLLIGVPDKLYIIGQDVMTGPSWPNSSSHVIPDVHVRTCGRKPEQGCLFDIQQDPAEYHSLAQVNTSIFVKLLAMVDAMQKTTYSPIRGKVDPGACNATISRRGYWGPWLE